MGLVVVNMEDKKIDASVVEQVIVNMEDEKVDARIVEQVIVNTEDKKIDARIVEQVNMEYKSIYAKIVVLKEEQVLIL